MKKDQLKTLHTQNTRLASIHIDKIFFRRVVAKVRIDKSHGLRKRVRKRFHKNRCSVRDISRLEERSVFDEEAVINHMSKQNIIFSWV